MSSIVTRTLPTDHLTPVRAYAALRAQSPGRSSFLFESALPGDRWGRYAVLGYRARSEGIYPGGFDPFEMIRSELADLGEHDASAGAGAIAGLAAALSRAMVGFIGYDALHRLHDLEPWPDEDYLGRVMKDTTVVVFDSAAQTLAIAGASQGAVNRCAWEMTHGPELLGLHPPDPDAQPEDVDISMSDEVYAAKVARARDRIAAGHASEVVLARTFRSPLRGADPLDVYRALRMLSPSRHLYFVDFAESPFAPGLTIVGASPDTLLRRGGGVAEEAAPGEAAAEGAPGPIDALRDAFLACAPTGAPRAGAAKIIRDLEGSTRHVFGGAVGFIGPGGTLELATGRQTIVLRQGYFEVTAGTGIGAGEPGDEAEATRREARVALAAIRAAHDAMKAREAAAERKAAAEKAAAEKAAAEKAAVEEAARHAAAEEAANLVAAERAAAEEAAKQAASEQAAAERPAAEEAAQHPPAEPAGGEGEAQGGGGGQRG
jgi:anthranilate synthase component 1